jgi:hypothetical protein
LHDTLRDIALRLAELVELGGQVTDPSFEIGSLVVGRILLRDCLL